MKYLALALITLGAFLGDFMAHYHHLGNKQTGGWSTTSTACLIYAAWFFWRGRDGRDI